MPKKKIRLPLVSVIIPAYNEEKYILKCLYSLKGQTFKNFEIIVVDDRSTDSTREVALRTGARLFTISHGGPGRAKNYGAKMAKGKILVFLDADMYVDKDYLKNIIKPILTRKCVGTYTTVEYVANKDNIWAKCWNINNNLPLDKRLIVNKNFKSLAFRAILKNKFEVVSGFDSSLGYSDDQSLGKAGFFAEPVNGAICYHYNPDSIKDVFFSARWIGRSPEFKLTIRNLMIYSILNSIRFSLKKFLDGAPLVFFIFKIIFDFGIFTGILFKNSRHNFAK